MTNIYNGLLSLATFSRKWGNVASSNISLEIFCITNLPQSPDINQNSDFRISGQSFIKENCYNARTSHDIDMKLGPVTAIDKRNTTTSKKFDGDVIVIFPVYVQFGAIQKPDSRRMICKTYSFVNGNFLSYKNWKQN